MGIDTGPTGAPPDVVDAAKLPSRRNGVRAVLLMLALITAFYLLREHWEHVSGRWAYLLLLACPLIHLFGHGGHRR